MSTRPQRVSFTTITFEPFSSSRSALFLKARTVITTVGLSPGVGA